MLNIMPRANIQIWEIFYFFITHVTKVKQREETKEIKTQTKICFYTMLTELYFLEFIATIIAITELRH